MKEIQATLGEDIRLGRRGESHARCVLFDVSEWQKVYGEGVVHLIHQRNGDPAPYPCTITVDGSHVCWVITNADVAYAGRGRVELQYFVGDTCVKSDIYTTTTMRSMGNAGPVPPEPQAGWVAQVLSAAQQAQEAVEHYPEVRNGTWWIWDAERGDFVDTGDPAQGEPGENGEPGPQGAQGPKGEQGPQGPAGYELTEADKEEIADSVLVAMEKYNDDIEQLNEQLYAILYGPRTSFTLVYDDPGTDGSSVDGTYLFVPGMTWGEWCNSEYNTIGAYVSEEFYAATYPGTVLYRVDDNVFAIVCSRSDEEYAADEKIEAQEYKTWWP